jgi:hypothetical protein
VLEKVRTYPVKRTVKLNPDTILEKAIKTFGNGKIEGDTVVATFPGLKSISSRMEKGKLCIETVTEKCDDPMEAIRKFNAFLEDVTGYSVSERKKLMSKV